MKKRLSVLSISTLNVDEDVVRVLDRKQRIIADVYFRRKENKWSGVNEITLPNANMFNMP